METETQADSKTILVRNLNLLVEEVGSDLEDAESMQVLISSEEHGSTFAASHSTQICNLYSSLAKLNTFSLSIDGSNIEAVVEFFELFSKASNPSIKKIELTFNTIQKSELWEKKVTISIINCINNLFKNNKLIQSLFIYVEGSGFRVTKNQTDNMKVEFKLLGMPAQVEFIKSFLEFIDHYNDIVKSISLLYVYATENQFEFRYEEEQSLTINTVDGELVSNIYKLQIKNFIVKHSKRFNILEFVFREKQETTAAHEILQDIMLKHYNYFLKQFELDNEFLKFSVSGDFSESLVEINVHELAQNLIPRLEALADVIETSETKTNVLLIVDTNLNCEKLLEVFTLFKQRISEVAEKINLSLKIEIENLWVEPHEPLQSIHALLAVIYDLKVSRIHIKNRVALEFPAFIKGIELKNIPPNIEFTFGPNHIDHEFEILDYSLEDKNGKLAFAKICIESSDDMEIYRLIEPIFNNDISFNNSLVTFIDMKVDAKVRLTSLPNSGTLQLTVKFPFAQEFEAGYQWYEEIFKLASQLPELHTFTLQRMQPEGWGLILPAMKEKFTELYFEYLPSLSNCRFLNTIHSAFPKAEKELIEELELETEENGIKEEKMELEQRAIDKAIAPSLQIRREIFYDVIDLLE